MGIGIKNGDWSTVIGKNKEEDKKRVKRGCTPRFPKAEHFPPSGNIHTTDEAERLIESRCTPRDENGRPLPSTARGRRRRERLASSK